MGKNEGRAELAERVRAIAASVDQNRTAELAGALDRLRATAQAHDLLPAAAVARAASLALGAGAARLVMHGWLQALGEALGCDGDQAGEAIMAVTALRFR